MLPVLQQRLEPRLVMLNTVVRGQVPAINDYEFHIPILGAKDMENSCVFCPHDPFGIKLIL